jgi:hypothetical protein
MLPPVKRDFKRLAGAGRIVTWPFADRAVPCNSADKLGDGETPHAAAICVATRRPIAWPAVVAPDTNTSKEFD